MVIIFIHDLQNRKSCKVIVRYLAEINVFDDFSQTVYADDNMPNATEFKKLRKQKKPQKYCFTFSVCNFQIHGKSRGVEVFY